MSHEIKLNCGHWVRLKDVEQYMTVVCDECGEITEIEIDGNWD